MQRNFDELVALDEQTMMVLSIDIRNFTTMCSTMSAMDVGQFVAGFFSTVSAVAAKHSGVTLVETRGDCCVCVCNEEQIMMDFAMELERCFGATVRIGVASGVANFLDMSDGHKSIYGPAVDKAQMAEAEAIPGQVAVYKEKPLKKRGSAFF
jgi:class 3 adenylate cyclase